MHMIYRQRNGKINRHYVNTRIPNARIHSLIQKIRSCDSDANMSDKVDEYERDTNVMDTEIDNRGRKLWILKNSCHVTNQNI